jgi:hypothetical protein
MNYQFIAAGVALACITLLESCTSRNGSSAARSGKDPWPEITAVSKPWSRWWWLGSDVDRENIDRLMELYAQAGIGGVEITPIYGVQGREDHYIEFLSPRWMEMLHATVLAADTYGMGVDMNLGTGWPFGGPQITHEYAASKLILQRYVIDKPGDLPERIVPDDPVQIKLGAKLEALMAWPEEGAPLDLTALVKDDGSFDWDPGKGRWILWAAFCGKTGQQVKRAAPGGEGFTMDHFSEDALNRYLSRFQEAFGGDPGVRCFLNDSYEVYNASWTPGFFDKFSQHRGYDLREYLREFAGYKNGPDGKEVTARLKSDYRETMSELLLENFTRPWTEWSHGEGAMTRNQAHGSPGNLIDLYAAVDIPECEIYGHRTFDIPGMRANEDDTHNVEPNPMMLKLATSAAHITNKPLVSNETFTWLGEHFKVALSQCKPEVEEAFLAGINHVFYHGIPYSPAEATWPGWLFYASVHFGPTNSFWPHLEGMNGYIARSQSLLQSGQADNEVLVYWPVYDVWHNAEGLDMQLSVHNIEEWLIYPGIEAMEQQGYSYDFISDALLQKVEFGKGKFISQAGAVQHRVLVVPTCRFMTLSTLQKIIALATEGGTVIFQELPEEVPGLYDLENRQNEFNRILASLKFIDMGEGIMEVRTGKGTILQCQDPGRALAHAGTTGESIAEYGLKYTRRSTTGGHIYFLVNHSPETIDAMVPFRSPARSAMIMDPQDGRFGLAESENGERVIRVKIQLQPGRSLFIRTFEKKPVVRAATWHYEKQRLEPLAVNGNWKLSFDSGGPVIPGQSELVTPIPWTDLKDPAASDFSGTATYSVTFSFSPLDADDYILQLGRVHESARVRLNGNNLGPLWSIPFEISVGSFLKEGENRLEIEVADLMANRIRAMDRAGIPWRIFHEINFVNIAYEPFDASGWEAEPSGLTGPVLLVPVQYQN